MRKGATWTLNGEVDSPGFVCKLLLITGKRKCFLAFERSQAVHYLTVQLDCLGEDVACGFIYLFFNLG